LHNPITQIWKTMTEQTINADEMKMDPAELYREEVYTDRKIGTIRALTPVTADGSVDSTRQITYVGQASMYTPAGALPLTFEIEADSLGEAAQKFGEQAKLAMERAIEELKEMRREASSQIVVPGAGGGMPGGGMPGGGGIQMP
jgi:hypothetical protein